MFVKISENELVLADELRNQLRKTREALLHHFDPKDPHFVSLREELERIFKKKNLAEVSQATMKENMGLLKAIYDQVKGLNRKNDLLKAKYDQDEKYVRVHKRLMEMGTLSLKEMQLFEALQTIKKATDAQLVHNGRLTENESYFNDYLMQIVVKELKKERKMNLDFATTQSVNQLIVNEYLNQYHGNRR